MTVVTSRQLAWPATPITMLARPRSIAFAIVLACLGLLAAVKVGLALQGLFAPFEHDYAESIVYGQASRLLRGEALYQPLDQWPFTVTAYTPLYYVLAGALQATLGRGFIWGRALSLVSGMAAAWCIGWLATGSSGSRWAGWLAAVTFLSLGFVVGMPWFGLYRVDTLGVALSVATIVVLAGGRSPGRLIAAGLLAGLAFLTKQTFVAAAIGGGLWLTSLDWRKAVLFGGCSGFLVVATGFYLELTTGAFLANTLGANLNPFTASVLVSLGGTLLFSQVMPLLGALFYLGQVRPWRIPRLRLLLLYWLASAIPLVGIGKVGAMPNYWIEFAATTSVLGTLGLWGAMRTSPQRVSGALSLTLLYVYVLYAALCVTAGPVRNTWANIGFLRAETNDGNAEFWQLVARVQTEPGDVVGEPMDVIALANKPIVLEPLIFSLLLDAQHWDPESAISRICSGKVGLLVVGRPIEELSLDRVWGYDVWPPPVAAALRDSMVAESKLAGRFIYVPRPDAGPAFTSAACAPAGSR